MYLIFYCSRFTFCSLALHICYPKSLLTVNGNAMVTQTAVMALMKPIVMNHVQTTSFLAKISSVSACLGAVMGMMIVVITLMKINVKLLLVHQVDTGQCACVVRVRSFDMHACGRMSLGQSPLETNGSSTDNFLVTRCS
jgi:hypothetical protein